MIWIRTFALIENKQKNFVHIFFGASRDINFRRLPQIQTKGLHLKTSMNFLGFKNPKLK
jgi:hypothetical protein